LDTLIEAHGGHAHSEIGAVRVVESDTTQLTELIVGVNRVFVNRVVGGGTVEEDSRRGQSERTVGEDGRRGRSERTVGEDGR
jgi:hypothetical protein